jgi:DNA-binding response OmpR family regulator
MILLVSDNNEFNNFAHPLLEDLGYVVFHIDKAHAINTAKKYCIHAVLVFIEDKASSTSRFCAKLRNALGDIKILTAVYKKPDSDSVYLEIPECDRQLILPCSADDFKFSAKHCFQNAISLGSLEMNYGRKNVYLLGYPLSLSKREYTILRMVSACHPSRLDDCLICKFLGGISRNCLSVSVCKINKKAALITGRHLIIRKEDRYCLNPFHLI